MGTGVPATHAPRSVWAVGGNPVSTSLTKREAADTWLQALQARFQPLVPQHHNKTSPLILH